MIIVRIVGITFIVGIRYTHLKMCGLMWPLLFSQTTKVHVPKTNLQPTLSTLSGPKVTTFGPFYVRFSSFLSFFLIVVRVREC